MTPITLPLEVFEEKRMINRATMWVLVLRHRVEDSREWLETELRRRLREGDLNITIKAVESADKNGDDIADLALRDVGAELQTPLLEKRNLLPAHLQVIAYLQRVATRAPHKRKRGRYDWSNYWVRNLLICFLVVLACQQFGLRPTRGRDSRRANRWPSGISVIVAALARNKIRVKERNVQDEIWPGLPGELTRRAIAERTWNFVPG